MENLLIMGINTRPMVNSALKLDYNTYSVSYFRTYDFVDPYKEKHVLDQESVDSCGFFEDNYSPQKLLNLSKEYLCPGGEFSTEAIDKDEIDKIVLITGIKANDFKGEFSRFKSRIRGNQNSENIDDKFKFHKMIMNKFDVPLTFKPNDVYELKDILEQYNDKQFILKPLKGNGGLGIYLLNYDSLNKLNDSENFFENISLDDYILQEHIDGTSISSSVLATRNERINIFNSRLISERDMGNNSFAYSGNIIPLDMNSFSFNGLNGLNGLNGYDGLNSLKGLDGLKGSDGLNGNNNPNGSIRHKRDSVFFEELNNEIKEVSEELIKEFKLIGSNGVDFILDRENNLKVIEINPRIQGTYELCEEIMGLNLLDAHIKACEGELAEIPEFNGKYAVKKIVYSERQVKIGNLSLDNVYDIPYEGVKIEAFQPIVTLINSNKDLNAAIGNINRAEEQVYKNIC